MNARAKRVVGESVIGRLEYASVFEPLERLAVRFPKRNLAHAPYARPRPAPAGPAHRPPPRPPRAGPAPRPPAARRVRPAGPALGASRAVGAAGRAPRLPCAARALRRDVVERAARPAPRPRPGADPRHGRRGTLRAHARRARPARGARAAVAVGRAVGAPALAIGRGGRRAQPPATT